MILLFVCLLLCGSSRGAIFDLVVRTGVNVTSFYESTPKC